MVYSRLYESQLPTLERALLVTARMVGSERSRGYSLEPVCADFLAGRTKESRPEEVRMRIQHLVTPLPPKYQARFAGQERGEESERAARCSRKSNRLNSDGRCIGV